MAESTFFQLLTNLQTSIDALDSILTGNDDEIVSVNGVNKDTISKAIKDNFSAIQAIVQGRIAFETKALMDAAGAPPSGELAEVWNDSDDSKNGLYGHNGSVWSKSKYDYIEALNTIKDSISESVLPFFQTMISDTSTPAFSRGNYNQAGSNGVPTIFGWRSAFKHNGEPFNAVQLYIHSGVSNRVAVVIESENHTVLARGVINIDSAAGVRLVALDKMVRTLDDGSVGFIRYHSVDLATTINYPAGGEYEASDVDPQTYPDAYIAAAGNWVNASPVNAYRINFRALNLTSSSKGMNIPAALTDIKSKVNLADWADSKLRQYGGDPLDEGFSSSYSRIGVGTQMPVLTEDIQFNHVKVFGGISIPGDVIFRVYITDSSIDGTHTPNNQQLLADVVVKGWDSEIIAREIDFDELITIPANKKAYFLWTSANESGDSLIARWTSDNGGGNYPLMGIRLSVPEDKYGTEAFDMDWGEGNSSYLSVPPILEVVPKRAKKAINNQSKLTPLLTVPSVITAVVGTELNIYYDGILHGVSNGTQGLDGIDVQITGAVGKALEREFRIKATSEKIGSHVMTIKVFDGVGELVLTQTFILKVIAATLPDTVRHVCQLGDSLSSAGQITIPLADNFVSLGGTTPVFVGSVGIEPIQFEAYGGWRFSSFASSGDIHYRFQVSGVASVGIGDEYTNNGSTFTVTEINTTSGVGNINTTKTGGNEPTASGTLAKASGSGDSVISFSSSSKEAGNPLWNPNTNQLDVAYYRANIGMGAEKIDIITMQLGINDSGIGDSLKTDADRLVIINNAKAIIDAFVADNANCKIIIALPSIGGNSKDGYGTNYGANYSKQAYETNIFALRGALLSAFDYGVYSANVTIGASGLCIDRYYGYGFSSAPVSDRVPTIIQRHNNGVHPATVGYEQMADAFFPEVLALINNV